VYLYLNDSNVMHYVRKIKFLAELHPSENTSCRLFEKILLTEWLLCVKICAKADEHL